MRSTLEQRKSLGASKDKTAKAVIEDLNKAQRHIWAVIRVVGPIHPVASEATCFIKREGPVY